MLSIVSNLVVGALVAAAIFFAARSVYRQFQSGGCSGCSGGCGKCSGGSCHCETKK
ncbi:hypothetical protein AGATL06_18150 [Agathobaculum sp. TL06]